MVGSYSEVWMKREYRSTESGRLRALVSSRGEASYRSVELHRLQSARARRTSKLCLSPGFAIAQATPRAKPDV
jgi:hypothetical protein